MKKEISSFKEIRKKNISLKHRYIISRLKNNLSYVFLSGIFLLFTLSLWFDGNWGFESTWINELLKYWMALSLLYSVYIPFRHFRKEFRFMCSFFEMEEAFYDWDIEKIVTKKEKKFFKFQFYFQKFSEELLLNFRGFNNWYSFKYDIFDVRSNKVKKEIEIYFYLVKEIIFSNPTLNTPLYNKTNPVLNNLVDEKTLKHIELFFKLFKDIFVENINALNLMTIENFFQLMTFDVKTDHEDLYDNIKKEVSDYYGNIGKIIEERNIKNFELKKLIIGNFFGTISAIITAYFVAKYLFL